MVIGAWALMLPLSQEVIQGHQNWHDSSISVALRYLVPGGGPESLASIWPLIVSEPQSHNNPEPYVSSRYSFDPEITMIPYDSTGNSYLYGPGYSMTLRSPPSLR